MPYLSTSSYKAPFWLPGGHAQTISPALFRKLPELKQERLRFATPDNDFINLDLLRAGANRAECAVILSHGLEGDSRRNYMLGMIMALSAQGWDCVSRNFRCCGGEINHTHIMYHSGETADLHRVVEYTLRQGYKRLMLVGFSMGGNQTLKYLGENPAQVPDEIKAAVAFSVPCHLAGSARELDKAKNRIYMRYFLKSLREKVRKKNTLFPYFYPTKNLDKITTFAEFDDRYTAPIHGFASARDYWERASCLPHLANIRIPTLLVNAENDPFLSPECFPVQIAENSPVFFLETPAQGGHVGFASGLGTPLYWSESRAVSFFKKHVQPAQARD